MAGRAKQLRICPKHKPEIIIVNSDECHTCNENFYFIHGSVPFKEHELELEDMFDKGYEEGWWAATHNGW